MAISRRSIFQAGSGFFGIFSGSRLLAFDRNRTPSANRSEIERNSTVFAYGVASGDPLSDRVILWTHISSQNDDEISVHWEVALDNRFEEVIAEGHTSARSESDFTVKIDARLPYPETTYFYRFIALDAVSPIGRTRTAATIQNDLRIAVVSCSSIWSGYFNAYERLARRDDIDLIIHCGDYAYDVPDPDELRNMPYRVQNTKSPASLDDHRQRYRYYRKNMQLQEAHQQHPFAIIWDNHDIWTEAPRSESIRAFWEWQPVRPQGEDCNRIYRRLPFGSLATVHLLDTRHYGRGQIIPGTNETSIIGEEQFHWLEDGLEEATSQWNIIASQVLFSPFKAFGKPLTKDSWQGFPEDSRRVRRLLAKDIVQNPIIVSGDAHLSYACNIEQDGSAAGVEFLPTSVTRGNLDENIASFLAPLVKGVVEGAVKLFNPHIRYFESESHGYGLVHLNRSEARLEFWYIDHRDRVSAERCAKAMVIANQAKRITQETAAPLQSFSQRRPPAPKAIHLYEKGLEIGGSGGNYFDGEERLALKSRLVRLGVRVDRDQFLQSLQFTYEDNQTWQMGKDEAHSPLSDIVLEEGEYLQSMTLSIGVRKKLTLVSSLRFSTSMGREFAFGRSSRQEVEFRAPEGFHIVSFHGRSGSYIDKLGPIYAPNF